VCTDRSVPLGMYWRSSRRQQVVPEDDEDVEAAKEDGVDVGECSPCSPSAHRAGGCTRAASRVTTARCWPGQQVHHRVRHCTTAARPSNATETRAARAEPVRWAGSLLRAPRSGVEQDRPTLHPHLSRRSRLGVRSPARPGWSKVPDASEPTAQRFKIKPCGGLRLERYGSGCAPAGNTAPTSTSAYSSSPAA
jgi:hypothetical protein